MARGEGLREQKKRETLDAIRRHAAELCLRDGYDNVTVDMICAAARISQRTFFNYVGTKENALLGATPPLPDERQRADYVEGLGGTPFEDLVLTLALVFVDARSRSTDLIRAQFAVIHQTPSLAVREAARMESAKESLTQLVRQRLAVDAGEAAPGEAAPENAAPGGAASGEVASGEAAPGDAAPGEAAPGEAAPGEAAPGEAEMTVALAVNVLHRMRRQWAQDAPADAEEAAHDALLLIRRVAAAGSA